MENTNSSPATPTKAALLYERLHAHGKGPRVIRYIVAGGSAAFVNLATLFVLVHFFAVHYLPASAAAFVVAFGVSFVLQKFWTFKDRERRAHKIGLQAVLYLGVALLNLGLNTLMMYMLVGVLGLWYMLGQFLASGLIAIWSYVIYRLVIFKHPPELKEPPAAASGSQS